MHADIDENSGLSRCEIDIDIWHMNSAFAADKVAIGISQNESSVNILRHTWFSRLHCWEKTYCKIEECNQDYVGACKRNRTDHLTVHADKSIITIMATG